jgi:hypothetical protein
MGEKPNSYWREILGDGYIGNIYKNCLLLPDFPEIRILPFWASHE